jgi:hypothetical protein
MGPFGNTTSNQDGTVWDDAETDKQDAQDMARKDYSGGYYVAK